MHARSPGIPAIAILLFATFLISSGFVVSVHAQPDSSERASNKRYSPTPPFPQQLREQIDYVMVVYFENRAFDNLFGAFPGVNGLNDAPDSAKVQTDQTGKPLTALQQPLANGAWRVNGKAKVTGCDPRFPATLPNAPYDARDHVEVADFTGDMIHNFYTEQYQINDPRSRIGSDPKNQGGAPMSKFSWWSTNPGLVMNNYNVEVSREFALARQYAIGDNLFHSAFGGSFLNHQWLVAARTPVWVANPPAPAGPPTAKSTGITQFDENGYPAQLPPKDNGPDKDGNPIISQGVSDRNVTDDPNLPGFPMSNTNQKLARGDYWAINTTFPLQGPAPARLNGNFTSRLPLQTHNTIGNRLTGKGITWAWFAGGWDDAVAGTADPRFQFHHQPFAYFEDYALAASPAQATENSPAVPGRESPGSEEFLKDYDNDFLPAVAAGDIPTVSFIKPIGEFNGHNGYSNLVLAGEFLQKLVDTVQANPDVWKRCVIFVTADEHGGLWDHVPPPIVDNWGPGLRVPLLVISPLAKTRFVDHSLYETASLLKFLEEMYRLKPLNEHDANAQAPIAPFIGQPDLIVKARAGEPFEYQLPAYNQPLHFTASGKLAGLSLDPATGRLHGTPPSPGSYSSHVAVPGMESGVEYSMRIDVLD